MDLIYKKEGMNEEKHIHGRIELPKPANRIAEQLAQYKTTVKDVRYILKQYGRLHPDEAFECIEKIVNDPKLNHRGGTH